MADGNVTTTTHATYIDEHWSPELNAAVELELVVANLFTDKSSELPSGDILHKPARHHLAADDKSASTALTPATITEADQTFQVSTHKAVAMRIEDIAEIQSKYAIRSGYTADMQYTLGRAMEVDASALLDDNTTQTVGVLGSELGYSNLLRARQYLRDSAFRGAGKMVVAPATYNGLLEQEQFTNSLYNGDTKGMAVREAQVGKIFNWTAYEAHLLPGTSPNAYGHVWLKDHFFKIVQRRPTTHTWYSPLDLAWIVSADCIYGMFELQEADEAAEVTTTARLAGVRLESKK